MYTSLGMEMIVGILPGCLHYLQSADLLILECLIWHGNGW